MTLESEFDLCCTFQIRDADQIKDKIDEEDRLSSANDCNHDLMIIQRMKLKGLKQRLAVIYENVKDLYDTAQRLIHTHPDEALSISNHQTEINIQWEVLTKKAAQQRAKLHDSWRLNRFLICFKWTGFAFWYFHFSSVATIYVKFYLAVGE